MSEHPDGKRAQLRTMVAAVELAMADVAAGPLRTAWQGLVAGLELGPEPAMRNCPRCGALGMRAATRCGHCWIVFERAPPV